jgi:hypothetical protein
MERIAGIEHVIEVGRQEGPRLVAERTRELRGALEDGLATLGPIAAGTWSRVMSRLRPTPRRRPGTLRLVVLSVALSLLATAIAIAISRVWERTRREREEREERDGVALSPSSGVRPVVAMPVAPDDEPAEPLASRAMDAADETEERVADALAS